MIPSFRKLQDDMSRARDRRKERLRRNRTKAGRRSFLEQLEDRRLLAVITVTTEDDFDNSDKISFREAIEFANRTNGPDTITFAPGIKTVHAGGSTKTLTSTGAENKTTIQGPITIDFRADRGLLIEKDVFAELRQVELINASQFGAIQNFGSLDVLSSAIVDNTSRDFDRTGGINVLGGSVKVINSTIAKNEGGNAGGLLIAPNAEAIVVNSTISDNSSERRAAGILVQPSGKLTIQNSIVAGNDSGPGDELVGAIEETSNNNIIGHQTFDVSKVISTSLVRRGNFPRYFPLVADSQAIDAGNADYFTEVTDWPLDQRGLNRFEGTIDIGAVERLESFDSVIRVTNGNDSGEGSLRAAIAAANANQAESTIVFEGVSQVPLTSGPLGLTNTDHKITIQGPVTIRNTREFTTILNINANVDIELSYVTLTGGDLSAIENSGNLSIVNSTLHGNRSLGARGSAINIRGGQVSIINSTISENESTGTGKPAIWIQDDDNPFEKAPPAQVTIINSTIANNGSTGDVGGIGVKSPTPDGVTITIQNSMVFRNWAESGGPVLPDGNGQGKHQSDIGAGVHAATGSGHNLIGHSSGTGLVNNQNGNIVDVAPSTAVIDNRLTDNGGNVLTHALLRNSPAIDAGDATLITPDTFTDQRGFTRVSGEGIDIGAVEYSSEVSAVEKAIVVTNGLDYGRGDSKVVGSLRWAVEEAEKDPGANTIRFASSVEKVMLDHRLELTSTGAVNKTTIQGPVTIDLKEGNEAFLWVREGVYAAFIGLEITGAKTSAIQTEGHLQIHSSTIHNNHARRSNPDFPGVVIGVGPGAIYVSGGQLNLVNSTISNNTAELRGSAVYVDSGKALIVNSTIANNKVTDLSNEWTEAPEYTPLGIIELATKRGGAVFAENDGTVELHNSIIAGNVSSGQGQVTGQFTGTFAHDLSGNISSQSSNNLVAAAQFGSLTLLLSAGLRDGENGNIIGQGGTGLRDVSTVIDTELKPNDKGILTHALIENSPAIDKGDIQWFESSQFTDQLGNPRIDGEGVDIGAVEMVQPDFSNNTLDLTQDFQVATGSNDAYLRFKTTGSFSQAGNAYSSNGSVQLGFSPTNGDDFTPLLHFRRGLTISFTSGTFLTTAGVIAATIEQTIDSGQGLDPEVQTLVLNLMAGSKKSVSEVSEDREPQTQNILIPLADLTSADGFQINPDDALEFRVSGNKSFKASSLGIRKDGNGVGHVEMSGFLALDALHGAGIRLEPGAKKSITGVTQANPAVVTSAGHGFATGDSIVIHDVAGMTELNGRTYTVGNVTDNTFTLTGVDSSSFTAFTSGGTVQSHNHLELSSTQATAFINAGSVPLKSPRNQDLKNNVDPPQGNETLTLTIAGTEYEFAQGEMQYNKRTQDFQLSGQARITYEGGHAELEFGKGTINSFFHIKDGDILLDRTRSANVIDFTVGYVEFTKEDSAATATVDLDLQRGVLSFNKAKFRGKTSNEIAGILQEDPSTKVVVDEQGNVTEVPLTSAEKQRIREERAERIAALGPEIEFQAADIEWTLRSGVVQDFSFAVPELSIDETIAIKNDPENTDPQLNMQVVYQPEKVGFNVRGGKQILTHTRDDETVAEMQVGLDELTVFRTTISGDGVIITNGRLDAFSIPVQELHVQNATDPELRFQSRDSNRQFQANYNPSSRELRVLGGAKLSSSTIPLGLGDLPLTVEVDFGSIDDFKTTSNGSSDLQFTKVANQTHIASARTASESDATSGAFSIYLPHGISGQAPYTLHYEVGGTATPGDDYTALNGSQELPERILYVDRGTGFEPRTFPLVEVQGIVDDRMIEGDETVTVTLKKLTDATGTEFPVDETPRTITIGDNDFPQTVFSSNKSGTDQITYQLIYLRATLRTQVPSDVVTTVTKDGFYHQGQALWDYEDNNHEHAYVRLNTKHDANGNPVLEERVLPTYLVGAHEEPNERLRSWAEPSNGEILVEGLAVSGTGLEFTPNTSNWRLHQPDDALVTVTVDGHAVPVQLPATFWRDGNHWRTDSSFQSHSAPAGSRSDFVFRVGAGDLLLAGMQVQGTGQIRFPKTLGGQIFTYTSDGPTKVKVGDSEFDTEQITLALELVDGSLTIKSGEEIQFTSGEVQGIEFVDVKAVYQNTDTTKGFALKGTGKAKEVDPETFKTRETDLDVKLGRFPADGDTEAPQKLIIQELIIQENGVTGATPLPGRIEVAGISLALDSLKATELKADDPLLKPGDFIEGTTRKFVGNITFDVGGTLLQLQLGDEEDPDVPGGIVFDSNAGKSELKSIGGQVSVVDEEGNAKSLTFGGVQITPKNLVLGYDAEEKTLTIGGAAMFTFGASGEPDAQTQAGEQTGDQADESDDISVEVSLTLEIQNGEISKVEAGLEGLPPLKLFGMELEFKSGGFSYTKENDEFAAWGEASLTTGKGREDDSAGSGTADQGTETDKKKRDTSSFLKDATIHFGANASLEDDDEGKSKEVAITGITKANSAVVTTAKKHPFETGDKVRIIGVKDMDRINTLFEVEIDKENPKKFKLKNPISKEYFDSSELEPYTSGGTVRLANAFVVNGKAVKVEDAQPGILIRNGKLESINVGVSLTAQVLGFEAKAEELRVTYSRTDSELTLTGGLTITVGRIGSFEGFEAKAAFPGKGLLINTKTGEVELRGLELSAEADIGPIHALAKFSYERNDDGETTIKGEGEVTLPGELTVGAGFEFKDGAFNAIRVKVAKENPGIQIGNTGVFLTSIEGEIKGISDPKELTVSLKITGSFGPTISIFGETASLVKISGELTFFKGTNAEGKKETSLELTGTVTVLEGWVGEATGSVKIFFEGDKFVELKANMRVYPGGIYRGDVLLEVDRNFNMTFKAKLAVTIPDNVPVVGGESLGSFEVYMQIRPNNNNRKDDYATVNAEIDLSVIEGRARITANFAGELFGFVEGELDLGFYSISKSKKFNLQIPGTGERDLVFFVPDTQNELDGLNSDHDAAPPELIIGEVVMDPDGPGGTVHFTGTSHLPDDTIIELFVDSDESGHNGHLLASGLAFDEGEQTYHWHDLAAFSSVPYDPSQRLYVWGRIYDGSNIPVESNYSAAITPPDLTPTISLPGEHTFGTNQSLVFSTGQQNAITFDDPLAEHHPHTELIVTLEVDHGTLTLDPQQVTPWTNVDDPSDVDGSGDTDVSDVLQLIAMLNDPALQAAGGDLPSQRSTFGVTPMLDVNGDGMLTAADAGALTDSLLNLDADAIAEFIGSEVLVEGDGTDRLLIIGTAFDINELLDGLTYQAFDNWFFDDRLEATVNRFPVFSFDVHSDSISLNARPLTVGAVSGFEFLPVSYEQGSEAARLLGDVNVASAASGHIRSGTIRIDGYDPEKDVLSLPLREQRELGIRAEFDAESGTLYLTGAALIREYERAIALTNFHSDGTGERVLRVQLGDGSSNVAETAVAVHIVTVNQAPEIETGTGSTYVSGSSTPVTLLPAIKVRDADSPTLHQAVITLDPDSYRMGEDVLTFEPDDRITGRFNALTGELVLSGAAGQRAWSAALSRVKYLNSHPTATPGVRHIDITVADGSSMNSTGSAHQRLLVVPDNMALQSAIIGNLPEETETFVERDGSITLAPSLTLTAGTAEIDSLVRIDVAFTDNFIPGSDFLSVGDLLLGMETSYDVMNGVLTITGDVPIDWYEYVLQSVKYSKRSLVHDGVPREITFTVYDGFTESAPQSMTAQFQALPVLRSGMEVLVYENGQSTHPLDANLSVMYAGDTLTSATVEFVWDYLDDQDRLLFTEQNGITGSFDEANGVLTLTGTATVDQYQQALRGVEYTNTRVNPIASFKQLNVFVEDGNIFSASVGLLLVVDTEQVAPTIDIATTVVGFTEGTNPIFVAADLIISEHDQPREDGEGAVFLTGAEAFIDGYVPGEDLLTFDTFESEPDADGNIVFIDGQFDTNNGVLSLIGRATPEQYESVLRSIRYENVSAAPSVHPRELKISAAQGIALAIAPPVTITVTSLNDPPTRIVAPPASVAILENAIHGSLGLEAIDYNPPHPQQPFVVLTVTGVPDAALGYIELSNDNATAIAEVGGVYTLEEIRNAVFVPALNVSGTGTFEFTVAGYNPILEQPDPAHLTESMTIEVAGVEGFGVTTVYDFDHLADGSLAGQDGWVQVAGGGSMTVTSGVLSASGDNQQMRPTDFGLSGDHVTVTAQLATRSGINGWQFGILHSDGTGAGSDFVFAVGNLGSSWRLRGGGFSSDITSLGTGVAEIISTLENYEIRLEIDLAAPSGSGAAQLFVNDVLVIENPTLGLTTTSLDPATWTGIHLRHAGGATLDSLSFSTGREATPGYAFTAQAFRDLLGRNATLEELDELNDRFVFDDLTDEGLRQELVGEIQFGQEYGERFVTAAFQRLLNRGPSQQELDEIFNPNDPVHLDVINNVLISSDEYFENRGGGTREGFVQAAFADLLEREPTAQELADAVAGLETGNATRADIAGQIEFSDEGAAITADQMIRFVLRRTGGTDALAVLIQENGREFALNTQMALEEYYVRYGTQTSAESRSADEIQAELILQWLQGTPTVGNSQVTTGFEAVGTINTDGRAHAGGTLIAPQYVLTAAHLVDGKDIDSLSFSVGLTSYGLDEVHVHPGYANELLGTDDGNDIAILKLNRPVIDVEPAALWGGQVRVGDELTLVGFGPYPGDDGFGTKRAGTTPIDGLTRNLITWTYDGADEATTVPGDSGSPQFVLDDGVYYIASLASGGTHQALSLGDFAYNTSIAGYADWIDSVTNSQVTRSVSEGLSFTDSSRATAFPSSFFTFNNNASVELSGDDLLIQDASTSGEDNAFYISTTATHVVISDAHHKLTSTIAGAIGSGSHTITVPLSSFTGNIVVKSGGGDDVINVTTPSRLVSIDGGGGLNRMVVNGSDSDEAEEFFVRESSGSLEVDMPTATTDGAYMVRATGVSELELNTGDGADTVRPQDLSGLTTSLSYFGLNLADGDDVLHGVNSTISMVADGGDGNDSLTGGTAGDWLQGGFGDDDLAGGPGDDTYVFDVDNFIGADSITENAGEGADTLDFSPTDFTSVGIDLRTTDVEQFVTTNGNLILHLSDHIENVTGGSHGNAIIGDEGVNILKGGNGLDLILGVGGADQIFGGDSVDVLQGSSDAMIDGGAGADMTEVSGADLAFPTNLLPVFNIAGIVPGRDYDQVRVPGEERTVTLGGELEVYLDDFNPQPGNQFTIVDLQSASSTLSGTFQHNGAPLNEGDSFTVEGHRFSISYVAGDGNDVSLTHVERLQGPTTVKIPAIGEVDVIGDGDDVVVRQKAKELLRTLGSQLQQLQITGTLGDDTYNIANLDALFAGLVGGNAGAGYDTLRLTGSGQTLDLTAIADSDLQGFEEIDLTGSGNNSLKLDVNAALNLTQSTDTLRVRHDNGDALEYGEGWAVEIPNIVGNQFVHILRQGNAKIEIDNTRPYHNPLRALDTNRDGSISPVDALIVINRIVDKGPGGLATPTSVAGLTQFFYVDTNQDNSISPIDALVVINYLNDPTRNSEGEAVAMPFVPSVVSQNASRIDAASVFPNEEINETEFANASPDHRLACAIQPSAPSSSDWHSVHDEALDEFLADDGLWDANDPLCHLSRHSE